MLRSFGIVAVLLLLCGSLGACQSGLSENDIEALVAAQMSHPDFQEAVHWSDEEIAALVAAQATHPAFLEASKWSDEEIRALVDAQMAHPDFQTTAREDCTTTILMAAVMSGTYELPPDSEVDRLCAWYLDQSTE